MDLAPTTSPPTPPRRSLVVAVEGADGTGKTALCAALADALTCQHIPTLSIKRPLPDSPARRHMDDALRSANPYKALRSLSLWARLNADATEAIRLARSTPAGVVTIFDRHWLSSIVEQGATVEAQREMHGEPDLWVICTAGWRTVQARLAARGGPDARQTVEGIAGRLARYEWLAERLTAPVVIVEPSRVHLPECASASAYTPTHAAVYIAAHIRYMQEHP